MEGYDEFTIFKFILWADAVSRKRNLAGGHRRSAVGFEPARKTDVCARFKKLRASECSCSERLETHIRHGGSRSMETGVGRDCRIREGQFYS